MGPLMKKDAAQDKLGDDAGSDGKESSLIALENAERKVADQENDGNENRWYKSIIETEPPIPRRRLGERHRLHDSRLAHLDSSTLCSLPGTRSTMVWILPRGQRISAFWICALLP